MSTNSISLLDLSEDILFEIAKYSSDAWIFFELYHPSFRKIGKRSRALFVELFTIVYEDREKKEWTLLGRLHRENDLPAVIGSDGHRKWYIHGKLHRENDRPASTYYYVQAWYIHGKLHRENDQPAWITSNGKKEWWYQGRKHREGDKPAVEGPEGMEWWINSRRHRDPKNGLPAVIKPYGIEWWVNGYRIRGDSEEEIVLAAKKMAERIEKDAEKERLMKIAGDLALKEHKKRLEEMYMNTLPLSLQEFIVTEKGRVIKPQEIKIEKDRCKAITLKGAQCKNREFDKGMCKIHIK